MEEIEQLDLLRQDLQALLLGETLINHCADFGVPYIKQVGHQTLQSAIIIDLQSFIDLLRNVYSISLRIISSIMQKLWNPFPAKLMQKAFK